MAVAEDQLHAVFSDQPDFRESDVIGDDQFGVEVLSPAFAVGTLTPAAQERMCKTLPDAIVPIDMEQGAGSLIRNIVWMRHGYPGSRARAYLFQRQSHRLADFRIGILFRREQRG